MDEGPKRSAALPVFLERQSYRRRRLIEAARLLPVLGAILLAIPLVWPDADGLGGEGFAAETVPLSNAIIYIFAVWMLLIGLSLIFGLRARGWSDPPGADDGPAPQTDGPK